MPQPARTMTYDAGPVEGHLLGIVHINMLDNFFHADLGIVIASGGLVALNANNRSKSTSGL